MSEYQYYEWQALDRPLNHEEQVAVNELSSHIEVTSFQAVVTYNWGQFKHDPIQVLAHYFDAFLYLASWGSKWMALRFPKDLLDPQQIEPYLWEDCIKLKLVGDYLILDIFLDEEEGEDWIEGSGWLSSLGRLLNDLLEGDYRALYLAWLCAAEHQGSDNSVLEPPVPRGLSELSPPLTSFVSFFGLNKYLLQAATEASPRCQQEPLIQLEEAIARLSPAERDAFLVRLVHGEAHLSLALKRRLEELTGVFRQATGEPRRKWGELQATAELLEREAKRRAAEATAAKRIRDLQSFARREAEAWREVVSLIDEKKPTSYDKAIALLLKLHDLADYQGSMANFQSRLESLRERYSNRPAMRKRLQRAGLI